MLLLIIVGLMFAIMSPWCYRIAKRLPVRIGENARNIYARLLARMWWRALIVAIIFGVILAASGQSPEEAGFRFGTVVGVYPVLFLLMLIPAWTAAKQRRTGDVAPAGDHRTELPITPKTVAVTTKSTWWKRLFTVLEITVALLAVTLDAMEVWRFGNAPAPWVLILIVAVPVGIIHLVRVGVTYVVEGTIR